MYKLLVMENLGSDIGWETFYFVTKAAIVRTFYAIKLNLQICSCVFPVSEP